MLGACSYFKYIALSRAFLLVPSDAPACAVISPKKFNWCISELFRKMVNKIVYKRKNAETKRSLVSQTSRS